jgi:prevent-host-death family protein
MKFSTNIKPISYLKSHTAEVVRDLEKGGNPMVITQNGEAKMVIESVHAYEQKEEVLALLKILAIGKKDAAAGRGVSANKFRKQLAASQPDDN